MQMPPDKGRGTAGLLAVAVDPMLDACKLDVIGPGRPRGPC